jgi:hypothetical protein
MNVELRGTAEIAKALDDAAARMAEAFRVGCFVAAQSVMDHAVKLTPKATGRLRGSAFVARTWPVEMGFAAPYAGAVHEIAARHPIGQSKFLAAALVPPGNVDVLARATADAIEGRTTLATAPTRYRTEGDPGGDVRPRRRPAARRRGR